MRDKLAVKNGIITLICQLSDVILGFIVRKIFIDYIGIEMLGVNGTFTSLLSTLSLAELGFESAVIYSLYKPMRENKRDDIEDIVSILKRIYEFVGLFVIGAGIIISFFLPAILKGIEVDTTIYIVFYVQLLGNAITYFLAYKKTFLLAQQKDYIRNLYTSGFKIVATIVQIILLFTLQSFILYVTVSVFQNLLTNYSISRYVDKNYRYKFKRKINLMLFKRILNDVKDIFFGKLAGYIYSSTDNIIISACVNTLSVGLLGNYTQILYQLKTVVNNVFASTKPIIGHFLTAEEDKNHTFQILKDYTFVRYTVSVALFVPGFVLCDCFISAWLGADYTLALVISLLLVTDIFIHFVHGALVDYIAGLGYFKQDRTISIIGAIINLSVSLVLVQVIGIAGVLAGTIISQLYFWISRSIAVFKQYFNDMKSKFITYWVMCIGEIIVFYGLCFICRFLFDLLPMNNTYLKFFVGGVGCFIIIVPTVVGIFGRTQEFKYLWQLMKRQLLKN